jgi:hypothetical protein
MRSVSCKAGFAALLLSVSLFSVSAAAFWGGPPGFAPPMPGYAPGYAPRYGYPPRPAMMPTYAPRPWGGRGYGWRPPQFAPAWRPAPVYQQSQLPKPALPGLCH